MQSRHGGRLSGPERRPRGKRVWRWTLRGDEMLCVVSPIAHLLIEKRVQFAVLSEMGAADPAEVHVLDRSLRALKRISYDA